MDGPAPYLELLWRQCSPSGLELSLFRAFARRLEEVQSEHVPVVCSVLETETNVAADLLRTHGLLVRVTARLLLHRCRVERRRLSGRGRCRRYGGRI
jgi:hypothetical protein